MIEKFLQPSWRKKEWKKEMKRKIFMEDLGACRDSFPVNVSSGRGGLYKENKMSSSVPLQPKHNIWCQMKSSLDNDEL